MPERVRCCQRCSKAISDIHDTIGEVVNRAIDRLPVALHIPGYRYCGAGTDLKSGLDIPGVNKLDEACKEHDLVYSFNKDSAVRAEADKELIDKAWARVRAPDSGWGERASALLVTNIMKLKRGTVSRRTRRGVTNLRERLRSHTK